MILVFSKKSPKLTKMKISLLFFGKLKKYTPMQWFLCATLFQTTKKHCQNNTKLISSKSLQKVGLWKVRGAGRVFWGVYHHRYNRCGHHFLLPAYCFSSQQKGMKRGLVVKVGRHCMVGFLIYFGIWELLAAPQIAFACEDMRVSNQVPHDVRPEMEPAEEISFSPRRMDQLCMDFSAVDHN
jgi:hypothetical protein